METEEINEEKKPLRPKSVVFGLLVLALGVLLLFRNTGMLPGGVRQIVFSWEMLLIAIGLINLFDRNRPLGVILVAVGVIFLLPDIFSIPVSLNRVFWPALIIIFGLVILVRPKGVCRGRRISQVSSGEDLLDDVAVFSGVERHITSNSFRGGKVVTVFGGAKLNLMHARLAPGVNELEVVCLFGGINLVAPADWNIKVEVTHVFGGFADKRINIQVDHEKVLVLKGVTIFGGGEVKNF